MAVSIDTVYQRVLSIANKEQRGYITPQEFNLLANQAQLEIFEQYFYDTNQFSRVPGNDTVYSDTLDILKEKIDHFEKYRQTVDMSAGSGVGILPDYYRMGEVLYYDSDGRYVDVDKVNQNAIHRILNSPLTKPTTARPVYVRYSGAGDGQAHRERRIQIYPTSITSNIQCNYIAKPTKVEWTYTIVNGEALYNSTSVKDFELHASEETKLVIKILELAGIVIKDPQLYQQAATEETETVQQEKQ